ncbi:Geranylgeranyl pyrophosphate synthase [Actinidia chinensis var. chinensis]|uniref:Geranylgeranyl pyrophosphate synthase n=1 Tax=Actinidia chinensis var. chinensis TaxID=1590841 RepID=A0A2R6PYR2_ACTCC|nr:Geranylgeranyl pyrophosphate synthase [Actinidia chinensis var. chinensis]
MLVRRSLQRDAGRSRGDVLEGKKRGGIRRRTSVGFQRRRSSPGRCPCRGGHRHSVRGCRVRAHAPAVGRSESIIASWIWGGSRREMASSRVLWTELAMWTCRI